MKLAMMVVLAAGLSAALAGPGDFRYISPGNTGGRTVSEEHLDQFNFAEKAPCISAYAPKGTVQPVLLESLRRLGAELFANVAFDPLDTPAGFRVRAGLAPAVPGTWDGVYLSGGDTLSEPYAKALDAAKEDAALVEKLRGLGMELRAKDDLILSAEGRRATKWLRGLDPQSLDPDMLRVEIGEWIRHLEAVLGRPQSARPRSAGAIAWQAPEPPEGLPRFDVKPKDKPVSLDNGGKISFDCDFRGFSISVTDPGARVTVELDMPGVADSRLRYGGELVHSSGEKAPPADYPEAAPFPGKGLLNYVQWRFDRCFLPGDWRPRHHGVYGRYYPGPVLSGKWEKSKDGKYAKAVFSAEWMSLWGVWPGCTDNRADRWRVTVGGDGCACDVLLVWPKGLPGRRAEYERGSAIGNLELAFKERADHLLAKHAFAAEEFRFMFAKTSGKSFHIGGVDSATVFRDAYLKPILDRKPTIERYATLAWDAADARVEYIEACLAGKKLKEPPLKRKSAIEAATEPDADLFGGIELDEVEE